MRLEKVDRDRVRDNLVSCGCKYVRLNHGGAFSGKVGRPDLEGLQFDGKFFGIEMKAEDKAIWQATTANQRLELAAIARAGGKAVVAKLEKDWNKGNGWWRVEFIFIRPDATPGPLLTRDLDEFCSAILG